MITLMTILNVLKLRNDVDRIYLNEKEDRRALINIKDCDHCYQWN